MKMKKMFFEVPANVHNAFKGACAIEGRTMKETLISWMSHLGDFHGTLDKSSEILRDVPMIDDEESGELF